HADLHLDRVDRVEGQDRYAWRDGLLWLELSAGDHAMVGSEEARVFEVLAGEPLLRDRLQRRRFVLLKVVRSDAAPIAQVLHPNELVSRAALGDQGLIEGELVVGGLERSEK